MGHDTQAQPERPEVREDELVLGWLAEDAEVGRPAVTHEVARARGIAAVLRALGVTLLRLLDLAADRGDDHVAPQSRAVLDQRPDGFDVARPARPSCSRSQPVDPAVAFEPFGRSRRMSRSHGSSPEYDVSRCPLNISVGPPPSPGQVPTTFARPSSTCCHITWSPSSSSSRAISARAGLLGARERRRRDQPQREVDQPPLVDHAGSTWNETVIVQATTASPASIGGAAASILAPKATCLGTGWYPASSLASTTAPTRTRGRRPRPPLARARSRRRLALPAAGRVVCGHLPAGPVHASLGRSTAPPMRSLSASGAAATVRLSAARKRRRRQRPCWS